MAHGGTGLDEVVVVVSLCGTITVLVRMPLEVESGKIPSSVHRNSDCLWQECPRHSPQGHAAPPTSKFNVINGCPWDEQC